LTPKLLNTVAAWSWRLLVIAGALTLVVVALIKLYVVVVPVLLALFMASVLEPAVTWLRRHRWPSLLAALTVFLAMLASLVLVVGWIASTTAEQFKDLGGAVDQGVEQVKTWLQGEPFRLTISKVELTGRRIPV
jgi:predicted PurR-regulated permease PerM